MPGVKGVLNDVPSRYSSEGIAADCSSSNVARNYHPRPLGPLHRSSHMMAHETDVTVPEVGQFGNIEVLMSCGMSQVICPLS